MHKNLISNLKSVRAMLAECWISWSTDNHEGGHCFLGCADVVAHGFTERKDIESHVNLAAQRLYPDLENARALRPDTRFDIFRCNPGVYVNNHLGKEAILAVCDDEIARLEVIKLCLEEERKGMEMELALQNA